MSIPEVQSHISNRHDLRRRRRYVVDAGVLQVSWINASGKMETTLTRALNISEHGISLLLPAAAMPMLVRFRFDRFKISGAGVVRYCCRAGAKYVVGLEFIEGLHWSPPNSATQPILN
jgi:hypothetical protein